ncbi:CRTAC1 family protein [uncultured Rubinisphaera sp.]|uniref:CRTAC1 family protein n=1 Tax=uncultured Rubinisphaera sp. TaxID=1678686 RepID=UPI0030DC2F4F
MKHQLLTFETFGVHALACRCLMIAFLLVFSGCEKPQTSKSDSPEIPMDSPLDHSFHNLNLISDSKPTEPTDSDWFEDITAQSGVDFSYHSGRSAGHYTMVEGLGGGVALFDMDLDGDLDLFCVGGGTITDDLQIKGLPCRLYRNEGNLHFVDVTAEFGLDIPLDYSHGITVGDVNHDRYPDLLITCFGSARLFENEQGKTFHDVSSRLGTSLTGWNTAACIADFNRDGRADLFVTGYLNWKPDPQEFCTDPDTGLRDVCVPSSFEGARDTLLIQQSDETFQDASTEYGLIQNGKGLGVLAADFNNNGHLDLYVANDVQRNFMYYGQTDGTWIERAVASGLSGNEYGAPEGSMGVDAADVNHDGLIDLTVANFELEDNDLYINEGEGLFAHSSAAYGLAGLCRPYVGFGIAFDDFNSDGWPDLVITNGHLVYRHRQYDYQQPTFLFQNREGRFQNMTSQAGPWFSVPHSGRGLATGDLNNDGAADLVISEQDAPISILINRQPPENWIGITLEGTTSGTDAIGSKVKVLEQSLTSSAQKISGRSYLSYCDPRFHFVLEKTIPQVDIEVIWPTGNRELFQDRNVREYHTLREGSGLKPEEVSNP